MEGISICTRGYNNELEVAKLRYDVDNSEQWNTNVLLGDAMESSLDKYRVIWHLWERFRYTRGRAWLVLLPYSLITREALVRLKSNASSAFLLASCLTEEAQPLNGLPRPYVMLEDLINTQPCATTGSVFAMDYYGSRSP